MKTRCKDYQGGESCLNLTGRFPNGCARLTGMEAQHQPLRASSHTSRRLQPPKANIIVQPSKLSAHGEANQNCISNKNHGKYQGQIYQMNQEEKKEKPNSQKV